MSISYSLRPITTARKQNRGNPFPAGKARKPTQEQRPQINHGAGFSNFSAGYFPVPVQPISIWTETVLPVQLLKDLPRQPEFLLALAVLQDALKSLKFHEGMKTQRSRRIVAEDRAWIASNDTSWQFSYLCICEAVGIDPIGLRRAVLGETV